jgi:protein-arginine kinase
MLLNKYLVEEVYENLKTITCDCGFTIDDIIASSKVNPDSSIGVYAGCSNCYENFSEIFSPIIKDYHNVSLQNKQPVDLNFIEANDFDNDFDDFIVSTRIRVGRNLKNFAFPPAISKENRLELESLMIKNFKTFSNELKGQYHSISSMNKQLINELIESHLLFKQGDRFLDAAGCNRDWPEARGIYLSEDKKFIVWVNEEDSLRIISIDKGFNLAQIFNRLIKGIKILDRNLDFARDDNLGFLSSCPTNLGTSMRASVHIKLPKLSLKSDFKNICSELGLSVRGTHGEHTESKGSIYDISNKARLGLSEIECINVLYKGIKKLVELEKSI